MYDVDWTKAHKQDYIGLQLDAVIALLQAQGALQMDEKDAIAQLSTDILAAIAAGQAASSAQNDALRAAQAAQAAAQAQVDGLTAGKVLEDQQLLDLQAAHDAAKAANEAALQASTDNTTAILALDETVKAAVANLKPSV